MPVLSRDDDIAAVRESEIRVRQTDEPHWLLEVEPYYEMLKRDLSEEEVFPAKVVKPTETDDHLEKEG